MESKAIARARKMPLETLVAKLNDGGFTPAERPIAESIIAEKTGAMTTEVEVIIEPTSKVKSGADEKAKPLTKLQQLIAKAHITGAIVAKTQTPKVEEEVKKSDKHKPNETTHTIEAFSDDTKGLRTGQTVSFPDSNKPGALIIEGKIQRIFAFYREVREEAKIKGTDGKRYYRFEKDIQPVVDVTIEA
jgi:hypothetical protein